MNNSGVHSFLSVVCSQLSVKSDNRLRSPGPASQSHGCGSFSDLKPQAASSHPQGAFCELKLPFICFNIVLRLTQHNTQLHSSKRDSSTSSRKVEYRNKISCEGKTTFSSWVCTKDLISITIICSPKSICVQWQLIVEFTGTLKRISLFYNFSHII